MTGANDGIGKSSVKLLVKKGAVVIMACRSVDKGEKAKLELIRDLTSYGKQRVDELKKISGLEKGASIDDLKEELGKRLIVKKVDLSSLQSVKYFCESVIREFVKLDSCIFNGGVGFVPFKLSVDGLESQIAINYFGHFYMASLLLPLITAGDLMDGYSTVSVVSSLSHTRTYPEGVRLNLEDLN